MTRASFYRCVDTFTVPHKGEGGSEREREREGGSANHMRLVEETETGLMNGATKQNTSTLRDHTQSQSKGTESGMIV
jgi:hypothetical protein